MINIKINVITKKEVKVNIEIKYDGDELRADMFYVESWVDGKIEYKEIANINKK